VKNIAIETPLNQGRLVHNNTQQYTTTLHNSTRVHKTTNVPVVFMARYVMILTFLGPNGTSEASAISGPKKSRFSGPTPSNAPHNDMYRAIKTTGTLIVLGTLRVVTISVHCLTSVAISVSPSCRPNSPTRCSASPEAESKEKHDVWDPMPLLTITST
jgi:hypothetical protein